MILNLYEISLPRAGRRIAIFMTLVISMACGIPDTSASRVAAPADTITVAKAFLNMPQQDLDLLSRSMRQDMLDYMEQRDSVYKKANIYMGLSWIETMQPGYMKVHLSDVSSLQIKLLPRQGRALPVVMTLYTIDDGNGTADTTLKFFDNAMQPLPTSGFMKIPDPEDFYNIPKDSPVGTKDLEEAFPFYTVCLTADPATGDLTGILTSSNALSIEEANRLSKYIRPELHWKWDGRRMQLQK